MNVPSDTRLGEEVAPSVAIIGAGDDIGTQVVDRLVADRRANETILALDARETPPERQRSGVIYEKVDVRSAELSERLRRHGIQCVVHLGSVRHPTPEMSVHDQYSIDVDGTHNVVESCLTADVLQLIVLGSAAAYGFHADTPSPVTEESPLRGNDEFAYTRHKRLVEESLARFRSANPELRQLIFRPAMILGAATTAAAAEPFLKPVMIGLSGFATTYSLVLDADVAACIIKGIRERRHGVFNLAADGVVTARDVARRTGARFYEIPVELLRAGLAFAKACRLTPYGAEQVAFLRYRPVLSNAALKRDFGFRPTLTSEQVFDLWWRERQRARLGAADSSR